MVWNSGILIRWTSRLSLETICIYTLNNSIFGNYLGNLGYLGNLQVNLANWQKGREDERRKLLMEEAELKQQGGMWTSVNKRRSRFVERWIFG